MSVRADDDVDGGRKAQAAVSFVEASNIFDDRDFYVQLLREVRLAPAHPSALARAGSGDSARTERRTATGNAKLRERGHRNVTK